ncbi:hypothetical protein V1511DRAFT_492712 [Dipodascopsis uninucleata]
MEIAQQEPLETYTSIEDLIDALPENSPRYILLSYPLTTRDGRLSTPYVMLYYLPVTSTQQARMLYAGAVEIIRSKAGVNK